MTPGDCGIRKRRFPVEKLARLQPLVRGDPLDRPAPTAIDAPLGDAAAFWTAVLAVTHPPTQWCRTWASDPVTPGFFFRSGTGHFWSPKFVRWAGGKLLN